MSVRPPPFTMLADPALHDRLVRFVTQVNQAIRTVPFYAINGGEFTSWYRTVRQNRDAKGEPESQHLLGLGADVVVPDFQEFSRHLRRQGLVALVFEEHVHIQSVPKGTLPFERFRRLVV